MEILTKKILKKILKQKQNKIILSYEYFVNN